jgi:AcrR family transcriptional regulator
MTGPGRGHWDRALTGDDRRQAHHSRLLRATAERFVEHGCGLTASHVVELAAVGRNTFYEHFASVDAAVVELCDVLNDAMRRAFGRASSNARTPIERLRSLATAWIAEATRGSSATIVVLRGDAAAKEASRTLRRELELSVTAAVASAKASGLVGLDPDAMRIRCVAAAFEAVALHHAEHRDADQRRSTELLVDLTLRAFR